MCPKIMKKRPLKSLVFTSSSSLNIEPSELSPEGALMAVLCALVHILAVAKRAGRKSFCAGAVEPSVNVGARAVAADPRPLDTLVLVDTLLAAGVQSVTARAIAPEGRMGKVMEATHC